MEKAPIINENQDGDEVVRQILNSEADVKVKIRNGEAYYKDEIDEKGNLKSITVYDSNTGEMIFFKDIKGLNRKTEIVD